MDEDTGGEHGLYLKAEETGYLGVISRVVSAPVKIRLENTEGSHLSK